MKMGQTVGTMPGTWDDLMAERDRVIHWSGEILARVDDNVTNEDTFLMNYSDDKIAEMVNGWIQANKDRLSKTFEKFPSATEECKNQIMSSADKIGEEMIAKIRKDYQGGYGDIRKFTKKVDQLGDEERKIHTEIQQLESECEGDVKKFQKKFGPLRAMVFNNLRTGEKMLFKDKRLKTAFSKKVDEINLKIKNECEKRIDKLIKEFEKCAKK